MAHKAESFRIGKKIVKKGKEKVEVDVIILYTNVQANIAEQMLIDRYLKMGYEPMFEEKKASVSVNEMRNELKQDEETLAKFEEIYKQKNGFHKACKIYSDWKKSQNNN